VLVGRPLALVRTRLQLELSGPPLSDPSWRFTFAPLKPDLPGYDFPIRLGDLTLHQDGLIGYFTGSDYSRFDSVAAPAQATSAYVQQIGPSNFLDLQFDPTSLAYLTMLVDPRAPVHAYDDILPVTVLAVPQQFVAPALAAMAITFRVGPLLTDLRVPETGTPQVVIPQPAEKNGTWSWVQAEADGSTTTYGIAAADQTAGFSSIPPVLRRGWLQLAAALSSSPPPESKETR
jgi:hypothetical protein